MLEKILVVEDNEMVCNGVVDVLRLRNWNTDTVRTYQEAVNKIKKEEYLLYIIDMMLPDGNGITLCREIRKTTNRPILFLSAYDSESYIVEGFEAGGNDYVIKPFRTFELLARIKSLLRNAEQMQTQRIKTGIKSGEYMLDLKRQHFYKNDDLIDLTLTEQRILQCLMNNAPNLVERSSLLKVVWDLNEMYVDGNTLSVYINRIRRKISSNNEAGPIETRRGIGYAWNLHIEDIYERVSEKTDY